MFLSLPLSLIFSVHPSLHPTNHQHPRSDTHKVQWSRTHLATQPVNLTLLCGLAAGRHRLCPVLLLVLIWGYTQHSMRSRRAGTGNIREKGWDRGKERGKGEEERQQERRWRVKKKLSEMREGSGRYTGARWAPLFQCQLHWTHAYEKCWLWLLLPDLKTRLKCVFNS